MATKDKNFYRERLGSMNSKHILWVFLVLFSPQISWGATTPSNPSAKIMQFKEDVKAGKIKIGLTRLNDVRATYGEPINITNTDKKVNYDYGDLKIEFEKRKYWRSWSYDSFETPAYTKQIDDLRYDLERREITGDNVTLDKIIKDYGQPTASMETTDDGGTSAYYYGDIKMIFENTIVVKSWIGQKLDEAGSSQTTETLSVLAPAATTPAPAAASDKETKSKAEKKPEASPSKP